MAQGKWSFSLSPGFGPRNMENWRHVNLKIKNPKLNGQHMTTSTKLEFAWIHIENMTKMSPTGKITDLTPVTYNNDNSMSVSIPNLSKVLPFLFEYEGFLFSLTSSIESFLAEINLICKLQIPNEQVYIKIVRDKMLAKYGNNNEFTNFILFLYNSSWFRYLGGLRNLIAHRASSSVIAATDLKLYLPDKPEAEQWTIKENIELFAKLTELINETQNSMNSGFGYLEKML